MFKPQFTISAKIANDLIKIEAAKQQVSGLPITPQVLAKLRETARLSSTHYSTQIEGNRLSQEQVKHVVKENKHYPSQEHHEKEVKGLYSAIDVMEKFVAQHAPISEKIIQTLHAVIMAGGTKKITPTPYRDGQNVIKEAGTGAIVYLPPEAKDVPKLMKDLVVWIKKSTDVPAPIVAGIAHYQFATIHPYYDGNGRVARMLATLILHVRGYDLKGIYSLEEYYAKDLTSYYRALTVGPSHNYYMGRAEADITSWLEYFCSGMAQSFEKVRSHAQQASQGAGKDYTKELRELDAKQRKALDLFRVQRFVTSNDIATFFGFKPRTARQLCLDWKQEGFIEEVDSSRKSRKYQLASKLLHLID